MKLKLDLHPIFDDSRRIEEALQGIIDDATNKRAAEVEIISGKGSGALKKSVLRFLDRPEIKTRYHRLEKDGDNWGRLFLYFRHERPDPTVKPKPAPEAPKISVACACCSDPITIPEPEDTAAESVKCDCPWCGSPNRLVFRRDRRGTLRANAKLYYTEDGETVV